MGTDATTRSAAKSILDAALDSTLTEADAHRLYGLGPEAVTPFALAMAASRGRTGGAAFAGINAGHRHALGPSARGQQPRREKSDRP